MSTEIKTISDLIEQLQKVRDEHGDLPVYCWPYDGQDCLCPIGHDAPLVPAALPDGTKVLFIE